MPHRALIKHRPWLLLSLLAGVTYFFAADEPIGGLWLMLWKGAGVGFLAIYAWLRTKGRDGLLIALVMALCATADMVLELDLLIGGAIFGLAHVVAIGLYLRNPREKVAPSQILAGAALLFLTPAIAGSIVFPLPNWAAATVYSALVGAMAAAAWTSRFPRYRVGVGAVMFVMSDLLIFSREAEVVPALVAAWLIWPLYYFGQFLIAVGVVQTLRKGKA
jgi:hypothetical protein